MTNRLNKPQIAELAQHFCTQGDRLKGTSSFHVLDVFKGACVTAFTKLHPNGIMIWVAYPVDDLDKRLPIEVEVHTVLRPYQKDFINRLARIKNSAMVAERTTVGIAPSLDFV